MSIMNPPANNEGEPCGHFPEYNVEHANIGAAHKIQFPSCLYDTAYELATETLMKARVNAPRVRDNGVTIYTADREVTVFMVGTDGKLHSMGFHLPLESDTVV